LDGSPGSIQDVTELHDADRALGGGARADGTSDEYIAEEHCGYSKGGSTSVLKAGHSSERYRTELSASRE